MSERFIVVDLSRFPNRVYYRACDYALVDTKAKGSPLEPAVGWTLDVGNDKQCMEFKALKLNYPEAYQAMTEGTAAEGL